MEMFSRLPTVTIEATQHSLDDVLIYSKEKQTDVQITMPRLKLFPQLFSVMSTDDQSSCCTSLEMKGVQALTTRPHRY